MDMCKKEGLHQVDLLTPAERKIIRKRILGTTPGTGKIR